MTSSKEPANGFTSTQLAIPNGLLVALTNGSMKIGGSSINQLISVGANPEGSRQHSMILQVLTDEGRQFSILAKVGRSGERTDVGHPWGIDQEVMAYSDPLSEVHAYRSPFIGAVNDGYGQTWMLLQWLGEAIPLPQGPHPMSIHRVAHWLGTFHRESSAWITKHQTSHQMVAYAGVVSAWATATTQALEPYVSAKSAIANILSDLPPALAPLVTAQETIVHGDFYPPNVLLTDTDVIPIDWEWIGVGPGEIDLAALTDGWADEVVESCVQTYWQARRPGHVPDDEDLQRLWAARLFLVARWLGGHVTESIPPPAHWLEKLELSYRRVVGFPR